MKNLLQKIFAIAIMLIAIQITLTAQPVGSQIKTDTSGHISYWNGVDTWIPIAPGLPGQNLQFTAGVPAWINNPNGITTTSVSNITTTTALCGGNILSDGGAKITARGVCWSTSPNPTIVDNKTIDGSGVGNFTSNLTDLNDGLTYYIRAYATNSFGTAYGNEISFSTPFPVYDIDGNGYDTVHIGTQVWMAENLKTNHYKNGTAIAYPGSDNTAWQNNTTGAYAWYNNDEATYKNTYGALYNWHAVNTGSLCPTGWHVPSDAEWTTLTTYLGGESIAGGKLKEVGLAHWISPNTAATNETRFTALPGGFRYYDGTYQTIGSHGFWRSSTFGTSTPLSRVMYYTNGETYSDSSDMSFGFSVRCIKD